MLVACVEALTATVPRNEVVSVYHKGSSNKRWDTLMDYVPELSDVDVHVLLADDSVAGTYLDPVDAGLGMQARLQPRFRELVPDPVHLPRLQLIVVNDLQKAPEYVPSPPATITPLIGPAPAAPTADEEALRAIAQRQLLVPEKYLSDLGRHVADMPGRHLWASVRNLTWRVAPTGPRVLQLLGVPYLEAWGSNRTGIARTLAAMGQEDLARQYGSFYYSAWRGFLSGWTNEEAARAAVRAGTAVLEAGMALAQEPTPH